MDSDRPTDDLIQRMLAAVVGTLGSEQHVDRLVAAARAEAEAEVKELLKAAIKATLLQRAVARLESDSSEIPAGAFDAAQPAAFESTVSDIASPLADADARADVDTRGGAATPAGTTGETACYIYGMVRGGREGDLPDDLAGIDPRTPLRFVRQGGVAALTSDISLAEFGPDAMAERVKDLRWVEEKVRAHDRVVKHLLGAGAVVPCRFGMVLRGEDDLRNLLAVHERDIVASLDALDGKKEWGVKVLAAAQSRAAARDVTSPESGKAYFLQKKRYELTRAEAARAVREAAEACHRELSAAAVGAAVLSTGNRGIGPAGGEGSGAAEVVGNAAYLVSDARADRFLAVVDSVAERFRPFGLTVELTGPWPPYNFVSLDLSLHPDDPPSGEAARPEAAA
jgi:hypothetical protein